MSNRRHARHPVPIPGEGQGYVVRCGVVGNRHLEPDVEQARTLTHDALIRDLGDRRLSRVWWTHHYAAEGRRVYDDLYRTGEQDAAAEAIHAETHARLADPASMLVIAWCIAREPAGATS